MTAADVLVTHGTVVTVDGADSVVHDGAVAVVGGAIAAVGPATELAAAYEAVTTLDAQGGIVLPGLVNAHTHLAMTMFRGFADDCDLQGFLDRLFPVEAAVLSDETVTVGVEVAIAEQLRAGITSALDMFWFPGAAGEVADRAGFRLHHGPVFVGATGPDGVPFDERLAGLAEWFDGATGTLGTPGHPRDGRWVFPHSAYTLAPRQLQAIGEAARAHGARLHIHAAENAAEVATVMDRHGRRPVELLGHLGLLGPDVVLAHTVDLTLAEIELMAATGTVSAHNPASNLKLASGFAPVPELITAGVTVALGTDGSASANDLDLFMAMRLAATIHKARTGDATVLPAARVLRMATVDGASALGLGDVLGSIEPGKRADLVVLHADRPHLVPSYDPVSTIVYAAGRADVRHVVIDGQLVVRDGECLTIDVAAAIDAMRTLAGTIANRSV